MVGIFNACLVVLEHTNFIYVLLLLIVTVSVEPLKQKSTCVHEKRVRFAADVKTDPKPKAISPPPKPSDVTAPPPSVPFAIKDEVELLRSGTVNKRGGRVKSQAVKITRDLRT
ncbi:hypothetical protein KIN20_019722 [Parelaphostrongylus tenuis]|uniref:Uncharacterized protein n=1 Tax=Parelaphostrongylus tenuis TaxID=148309 RepID=A0AAD5MLH0_PARTN|nr:hypothetical protein KIN20_019722 [Parelaphostrongylus tenuis]